MTDQQQELSIFPPAIEEHDDMVPIGNIVECVDCNARIDKDTDEYIEYGEEYVCTDCSADNFVWSEFADEHIPADEAVYLSDCEEYVHELSDDYFACEDCGNHYSHRHTGSYSVDNDYMTVCEGCINSGEYSYCEDIEQYAQNENCYYDDYSDCCYFYEDNMRRQCGGLHCYSANVLEVLNYQCFVSGQSTQTFGSHLVMGVELETDDRHTDDIVQVLSDRTDLQDYAICKSDATCSGPEIVTLPADLDSHKQVYSWDSWCEVLRPMAKGFHGSDNGMHIHVNRGALPATVLGKVLVFMNSPDNVEFLQVVAQRQINGWCRTNSSKYDSVAKAAAEPADGKYSVVNVTQNTAEFRMFNSTLLAPRIYKNLEFCDAIVRYCEQQSNDHRADYLIPNNFIRYVHRNAPRYPYLSEFLNARWQ
jgi:hypothetical protein